MSKILALKSIPLSEQTRHAWHETGVRFAHRRRTNREIQNLVDEYGYEIVVNLGDKGFASETVPVYNHINSVMAVMEPLALRRTFNGAYLPNSVHDGSHWHKHSGWGGAGKTYLTGREASCEYFNAETQSHIAGSEYRVISVGDIVVQASRKDQIGETIGEFDWTWIGVNGIRNNGIIPVVKEAVRLIPFWNRTVFGWDFIVSEDNGRPFVIEINSCPGVNDATARRIVDAIDVNERKEQ